MPLIPPQFLAAGAAAMLVGGAFVGWTARDWKADADILKAERAADKREDQARAAVWSRADQRERDREQNQTQLVRDSHTIREIVKNGPPIPADCAASADLRRVLNDAVASANADASRQLGKPLPTDTGATRPAD